MKSREFRIARTLAFAIALTVLAGSKPLAAQPPEKTKGEIYNSFSDKCLQPLNGSTAAGAAIVLAICNQSPTQTWKSVAVKFPYIHYVNQLSGMCLDARGGATNTTPVQQWPCDQITNELWVYASIPQVNFSPVVYSGVAGSYPKFCLAVPTGATAVGVPVEIYSCKGNAEERWFTP